MSYNDLLYLYRGLIALQSSGMLDELHVRNFIIVCDRSISDFTCAEATDISFRCCELLRFFPSASFSFV